MLANPALQKDRAMYEQAKDVSATHSLKHNES
jgi:hypothetical protein